MIFNLKENIEKAELKMQKFLWHLL